MTMILLMYIRIINYFITYYILYRQQYYSICMSTYLSKTNLISKNYFFSKNLPPLCSSLFWRDSSHFLALHGTPFFLINNPPVLSVPPEAFKRV